MFTDPAAIVINGVTENLIRINQDKYSSEYCLRGSLSELRMNIRNSSYVDKKRGVTIDRHNVELINTIFPVAPSTVSTVRKAYVVLENQRGDDLTAFNKFCQGLLGYLHEETKVAKLLNFES
jgi:hypothetical protein